jgi:hypothetical protein
MRSLICALAYHAKALWIYFPWLTQKMFRKVISQQALRENERNKLFVRVTHFWDLLFQLMKHGTNTLHVAFIFLFSIDIGD